MMGKPKLIHFTYVWTSSSVSSFIANIATELSADFDQSVLVWDNRGSVFDEALNNKKIDVVTLHSGKSHGLMDLPLACMRLKHYLQKNKTDIIHLHCSTSPELRFLEIAKQSHVPIRIAHSHETTFYGSKLSRYFKEQIHIAYKDEYLPFSTERLAESKEAGEWLFNDADFSVVNTPLDIERYRYDENKRKLYRKNHNISSSAFVFCTTGRLNEQYNPLLLIESFSRFHQKNPDSFLIFACESHMADAINEAITRFGVEHCIIFASLTDDISSILSASDGYVLLSQKPTYGLSALEAQANGLPCLLSNTISKEIDLLGNSVRNSWDASPVLWTKAFELLTELKRYDGYSLVKSKGYSKEKVASYLATIYHSDILDND